MIQAALISSGAVFLAALLSAAVSWWSTNDLRARSGRRYLVGLEREITNLNEILQRILNNPHVTEHAPTGNRYEFYAYQVPQKYAPIYLSYSASFGETDEVLVSEVFDFYSKLLNMKHEASTPSGHITYIDKGDLEDAIRLAGRALEAVKSKLKKV